MLPSLKIIKAGLERTTEALAADLGALQPDAATPPWNDFEWKIACAVAVAHGVSPLLAGTSRWQHARWRAFLEGQRNHVASRHLKIAELLNGIDKAGLASNLPIVALKGSALHALGLYRPGERPMADIDLLVRDTDVTAATTILAELGYTKSYVSWKHIVFKPPSTHYIACLGEHRDTQINIELHTQIQERLPVSAVDITHRVYPRNPVPGLNAYPSLGALMSHILLHAAGNIRVRTVRLLHLNDIARIARRMTNADWAVVCDEAATGTAWWALPPLQLTARYYRDAVPEVVLTRLRAQCPPMLRLVASRQSLTEASCSRLWVQAFPGIEWARSLKEAGRLVGERLWPSSAAIRERADAVLSFPWIQAHGSSRSDRSRLMLKRLVSQVPRLDTMYVVHGAFAHDAD